MKKMLAFLLILMMLLPCTLAAADGAMTDKAISFAEFTFGDTFGNIRNLAKITSVDFKYYTYPSRCVADVIDNLSTFVDHDETYAKCMMLRLSGQRKVAGHDAGACLWFVYPTVGSIDDNSSIFYAGEYEFETNGDAPGVFADLKDKLSQVYGDPFYTGNDISVAMGEFPLDDGGMERYKGDNERYQPDYAVWKSSANNTVIVLKHFLQYGDWDCVKLAYISDIADAIFEQYTVAAPVSDNNSLEGL